MPTINPKPRKINKKTAPDAYKPSIVVREPLTTQNYHTANPIWKPIAKILTKFFKSMRNEAGKRA